MMSSKFMMHARLALSILGSVAWFPSTAAAQGARAHPAPPMLPTDSARMAGMADHVMSGAMDENMMKHMELSPLRPATHDDSVRAAIVVAALKRTIARYQDTAAAVADGYKMFLPRVKTQRVYHFTNNAHALMSMFRFDPAQPTSVLYKPGKDGQLHLIGAMYTLGKNASLTRLNNRVPLSIARWHKHVNWCLPKKGDAAHWAEQKNGRPVFGPESSIATRAACDAVDGDFHPNVFGWMLHANVFEGHDLASIFADDHR